MATARLFEVHRVQRSLRLQATALLLLALGLTTVVVAAISLRVLERDSRAELARRGSAVVALLQNDAGLRLALSLRDAERARAVLQGYAQADEDVRLLALLDADKKPIAWAPAAIDSAQLDALLAAEGDLLQFRQPIVQSAAAGGELDFAVGEPADAARKEALGYLQLGLSDARMRQRMRAQSLLTVLLTGALLFALFLLYFSRVQRRLNRLTAFAEQLAAGDLRGRIEDASPDELGRLAKALCGLAERSQALVGRMQEASAALATRSEQLLSTARTSAEQVSGQAASMGQMGVAVAQLRSGYTAALARAQEVIELARQSEESSRQGRGAVQQSVGEMQAVREQVARIGDAIGRVVERTAEIGTITRTVREIAEQTSVLALNAGIEAARAGDQGRGFAVVAHEEHKLAEESKAATAQVRGMLRDIEQAIRAAVAVVQEGQRAAERGMAVAHGSGEAIDRLAEVIQGSSRAAQEIASSMHQQFVGVDQIFDATRTIETNSAQTASRIQLIEGAAAEARALAESLRELVARYEV